MPSLIPFMRLLHYSPRAATPHSGACLLASSLYFKPRGSPRPPCSLGGCLHSLFPHPRLPARPITRSPNISYTSKPIRSLQTHNSKYPRVPLRGEGGCGVGGASRDSAEFVAMFLSRSGGEKGLRGSGAGTLGVPLEGTRRVGDSRARTRSPSPRAWRPDFPGAAREAP